MADGILRVSWASKPREMKSVSVPASKSELNRFLILAALREGRTEVSGRNDCEDVRKMAGALRELGVSVESTVSGFTVSGGRRAILEGDGKDVILDCGSGGTTFRFLLAVSALRPARTGLRVSPQLAARPIEPLTEALRSVGARIERSPAGFAVTGNASWGNRIEIPADQSSQFASAIALSVSALERPTELVLLGDLVSVPYWNLTLDCLRAAGTRVTALPRGAVISAAPAEDRERSVTWKAEGDASSAAVWLAAGALGWPVAVGNYPKSQRQADTALTGILSHFYCEVKRDERGTWASPTGEAGAERYIQLKHAPDLAPVLSVLSALLPGKTRIIGAEHLRYKESNRIDELSNVMGRLGIRMTPHSDGLEIEGRQKPGPGILDPLGDHRLAMAGALLAFGTSHVKIRNPESVAKSYPDFWEHAAAVGWKIE